MDSNIEQNIKEANIKLHNFSAKNYDNYPPYLIKKLKQLFVNDIFFCIQNIKTKNIKVKLLDCGCGTGILADVILKNLTDKIYIDCLDSSKEMILITKNKTQNKCNKYIIDDIDNHLLNCDKYDLICFTSVLHHIGDFKKTLKLANKKLNKGGIIYIADEPQKRNNVSKSLMLNIFELCTGNLINIYRLIKNPKHAINFIKNKDKLNVGLAEYHATIGGIDIKEIENIFSNYALLDYNLYLMHPFKFMELFNFLYENQSKTFKIIMRKEK